MHLFFCIYIETMHQEIKTYLGKDIAALGAPQRFLINSIHRFIMYVFTYNYYTVISSIFIKQFRRNIDLKN